MTHPISRLFGRRLLRLATSAVLFASTAFAQTGGGNSLGDYVFTAPQGWATSHYPDGIVLTSPGSATGEHCMISMWPMRPAGQNLLRDADTAFQQIFSTYEARNQTSRGTDLRPSIIQGLSGQGWEYLILKRGIGKPRMGQTTFESLLGFVFVARLNNQLAVISGLSKDPLVSTCMGELAHDAWPEFFYSLGFKNWTPVDRTAILQKALAGTWSTATATVADQFTFAANGRYASAAASQQYHLLSNSEVLETTQGFFGDGAYTLKGNILVMTPDNHSRSPETALFRIEKETNDMGQSWTEKLYLMRRSTVDGAIYEVGLKKH